MRYAISDLHGNYDLFIKMLKEINFSKDDKLFILGDIIDKGKDSGKLLNLLCHDMRENIVAICGNHEYEFIKFVNLLTEKNTGDEEILNECSRFLNLKEKISFEEIDFIKNMPFYVEEDDCVLVHAGIPLDEQCNPLPLETAKPEDFVYDRRFKDEFIFPKNYKCVIFGHTPTCYSINHPEILKFLKPNAIGDKLSDYYKIQIDTGNYLTGVLGCLCLDTIERFYVDENDFPLGWYNFY